MSNHSTRLRRNTVVLGATAALLGLLFLYPTSTNRTNSASRRGAGWDRRHRACGRHRDGERHFRRHPLRPCAGAGHDPVSATRGGERDRLSVACHEHGTGLTGFLPASWDHLGCQSWDHPARLAGLSLVRSLTARVMSVDAEVIERGIQGGQCG